MRSWRSLSELDCASLAISAGDRIGLIGRNGTGKSSLLGVLTGRIALDDGEVQRKPGLRVALVEQEPLLPEAPTVRDSLLARGEIGAINNEWLDERDRHAAETRLAEYLHRFSVNTAASGSTGEGGLARRARLRSWYSAATVRRSAPTCRRIASRDTGAPAAEPSVPGSPTAGPRRLCRSS